LGRPFGGPFGLRRGIEQGRFDGAHSPSPEQVAVLTIALVDGMGIPLALSDPEITVPGAAQAVLDRCVGFFALAGDRMGLGGPGGSSGCRGWTAAGLGGGARGRR
jgi:hypothetical protein